MMTCTGFAFLVVSMTCTPVATPPTDSFCQNYKPVYWSPKDTRRSKEENDINNRKWKRLCRQGKK